MDEHQPAQEVQEPIKEQPLTGQTSLFEDEPAAPQKPEETAEKRYITFNANADPKLDPNSPDFDPDLYKVAMEKYEIKKYLPVIQFAIDFLKNPEDTLLLWGMGERYTTWNKNHFARLVQGIAEQTGADVEQIVNPDTRTPQQQEALVKAAAEEQLDRLNRFFDSNYMQALNALEPLKVEYPDPAQADETGDIISLKEQAVMYFFAMHRDIRPDAPHGLTEGDIDEIKANLARIDAYYMTKTDGGRTAEPDGLFLDFIENDTGKQQSKATRAEQTGAIMTIGERLFVPSDPEYQNAFSTSVSAKIGLFKRDEGTINKELALDINTPFLQALAKAVFVDYLSGAQGETKVYFPTFARELGLDINHKAAQVESEQGISRADARQLFINKLLVEIDNIWGKLPNDSTEYKLISVHAYNPDTEVLYFVSPYFQRLIGALVEKEANQLNSGKRYYLWNCDLLHGTAANDRNPAAVEMATRILVGLQQRGNKPDSKLPKNKNKKFEDEKAVIYTISCAGLIQECPQIREKLKAQPNTGRKTEIIKRTFTAMYRILKKKTDLFTYYTDVTITEVIPTAKSLNAEIIIQHHGSNPRYQRPFLPIKEEPTAQ